MIERLVACTLGVFLAATSGSAWAKLPHSPCGERNTLPGCQQKYFSAKTVPYTPKTYKDHGLKDEMSPQGRKARGFYLTPYYLHAVGAKKAAQVMKRAHMNAVVLDVKDDLGRILYPSQVSLSEGLQKHLIRDPRQVLKTFHENGIYVIARVVSFKDSRLPYKRPDLAVRIDKNGRRLFSAGANWLDAYSSEVQDYLVDLSLELEELGFDEIQFDYIRFPKGRITRYATWLHQDDRRRETLISQFLEKVDRALRIPISVDIYGLTTLVDGDPRTLGQNIENMIPYVEAISPMMYANGMNTYFKNDTVTEGVYSLIHCGLWRARQKAPHIVLRPFLQAYPNSVESFFGPAFIIRQLEASFSAGSDGFLFWNATMQNGVAYRALQQLGDKRLTQLAEQGSEKARETRPSSWCKTSGNVFVGGAESERKPPPRKRPSVRSAP